MTIFAFRCLKGPKENDPIPQVFYTGPRSKQPMSNLVEFNVYGREDYKKDGPQVVQVGFTLSIGSESYNLPVTMVGHKGEDFFTTLFICSQLIKMCNTFSKKDLLCLYQSFVCVCVCVCLIISLCVCVYIYIYVLPEVNIVLLSTLTLSPQGF